MEAIAIGHASFMALEAIAQDRVTARSGAPNQTRAKVHPNSKEAGTFEDEFFYRYPKGEPDRLYEKAAALLEQKNAIKRLARAEGRALTADEALAVRMTYCALRIFGELTMLARVCHGQVFPSWAWLEKRTGTSRATVHRALNILADLGLIERQRRCVRIEPTAERPKAKWAQTSNAYRMRFPNRLVRFLPMKYRPVPLPGDVVQREAERAEQLAAMRLWRTPSQRIAEDIDDEGLQLALQGLLHCLELGGSQKDDQPLPIYLRNRADGVGLVGQRHRA